MGAAAAVAAQRVGGAKVWTWPQVAWRSTCPCVRFLLLFSAPCDARLVRGRVLGPCSRARSRCGFCEFRRVLGYVAQHGRCSKGISQEEKSAVVHLVSKPIILVLIYRAIDPRDPARVSCIRPATDTVTTRRPTGPDNRDADLARRAKAKRCNRVASACDPLPLRYKFTHQPRSISFTSVFRRSSTLLIHARSNHPKSASCCCCCCCCRRLPTAPHSSCNPVPRRSESLPPPLAPLSHKLAVAEAATTAAAAAAARARPRIRPRANYCWKGARGGGEAL